MGPAGGAIFAAEIAARQHDKVLSFDMGGTTAKICLIQNHTPKPRGCLKWHAAIDLKKALVPFPFRLLIWSKSGYAAARLPMLTSFKFALARKCRLEPGPACYGRGGECPAVTDADLIGVDPDNFAGGRFSWKPGNRLPHSMPILARYWIWMQ